MKVIINKIDWRKNLSEKKKKKKQKNDARTI